jgi:hypothetical protein
MKSKPPVEHYSYYQITQSRKEYLGVRYFKVRQSFKDSVIQVVVNPGQERKGRGNTFGVYLISRMTFFSNYLAMVYAIPCTKKDYDKAFDTVLKYLKN